MSAVNASEGSIHGSESCIRRWPPVLYKHTDAPRWDAHPRHRKLRETVFTLRHRYEVLGYGRGLCGGGLAAIHAVPLSEAASWTALPGSGTVVASFG